ncbi:MAG: ribosome biogenesis GTP-binding protein YihA/YsxC, partial [Bacteroidaceae bacterium]
SPRADMCPKTTEPEYAFIGRSNVGKSSLINMLTRHNKLAMTSSTPGKTMLVNHFIINNEWYIVDLPGYGFAQRGKREMDKLKNLIEHYVLEREQLTCLFVLIDIRHEPQKKDLEFINFLGENGVPFALVFTKADKIGKQKVNAQVNAYLKQLKDHWEELPPHFITSAETGLGRDDILNYIESVNKSLEEQPE